MQACTRSLASQRTCTTNTPRCARLRRRTGPASSSLGTIEKAPKKLRGVPRRQRGMDAAPQWRGTTRRYARPGTDGGVGLSATICPSRPLGSARIVAAIPDAET